MGMYDFVGDVQIKCGRILLVSTRGLIIFH